MAKPILVLNCGSSSIKFALFEGDLRPLPRKPMWSGKIDGIGGEKVVLVGADASLTRLVLDEANRANAHTISRTTAAFASLWNRRTKNGSRRRTRSPWFAEVPTL